MELHRLSATDLAARLHAGSVTATEALAACLERIEKHNPELTAVVSLDAEAAARHAAEADEALRRGDDVGPLHGVPMTLKDATTSPACAPRSARRRSTGWRRTTARSPRDCGRPGRT